MAEYLLWLNSSVVRLGTMVFFIAVVNSEAAAQLPILTVSASDSQASEVGLDAGEFTFTRTGGNMASSLTFFITTSGSSAGEGGDYVFLGVNSGLTFAANNATLVLPITPLADNLAEGDEQVVFSFLPQSTYEIGSPSTASVTIADNPATLTVVASDSDAAELGLDSGELTFSRSGGDLSVALSFFINTAGTEAQNGVDYAAVNSPLTFPANESTLAVPIQPLADNAAEGDEAAVFNVSPQSTYVIGNPGSATITIADDATLLSLVASDAQAAELGQDPGELTFSRTGGDPSNALDFFINNNSSTATNGTDYVAVSTFLTFPANETTWTIPITPLVDNTVEDDETAVFNLAVQPSYLISGPGTATVTIADNAAVLTLTATDAEAAERGSNDGEITFTRSGGDIDSELDFFFNNTGSSAVNGTDYVAIATFQTFPAGVTTVAINVTGMADEIEEGTETAVFNLAPQPSYALGTPNSATISILDILDDVFSDGFEQFLAAKTCALTREKLQGSQSLLEVGDGTVLDVETDLQWALCWLGEHADLSSGTCQQKVTDNFARENHEYALAGYLDWRYPTAGETEDLQTKTCDLKSGRVPVRPVRDY